MVRHYVNQGVNKQYPVEVKWEAIELYKELGNYENVARRIGANSSTVRWWVKNPHRLRKCGRRRALDIWEEEHICDVIVTLSEAGLTMKRKGIKDMVQSYCIDVEKEVPFYNKRPGKDWVLSLERRWEHILIRRWREGIGWKRARGLTKENVDHFYGLFENLVEKYDIEPNHMWNTDETAFQTENSAGKVYVGADRRHAYSVQSEGGKSTYSVLFCCNATGTLLPPMTVYQSKKLYLDWQKGGVEGASYTCTPNGMMLDINFENWFRTQFLPLSKPRRPDVHRLLILDGHNSHISYSLIKLAKDNNVHLLCLPPGSSHALQPLDVAVFKAVKDVWREVCIEYFRHSPMQTLGKKKSSPQP